MRILGVTTLLGACTWTERRSAAPAPSQPPPVSSIGIAPLRNLTGAGNAADVLADALLVELAERVPAQVVDARALAREDLDGPVERSRACDLGRVAEVDAVLFGTVLEYEQFSAPSGNGPDVPSIALQARLVSVASGSLLWAASVVTSPSQLWTNNAMTLHELAHVAAAELVGDLAAHWAPCEGPDCARPARAERPPPPPEVAPADVVELPLSTP